MKVYVLMGCIEYEGCSLIDIYKNKETRDAEFERLEKLSIDERWKMNINYYHYCEKYDWEVNEL